MNTRPTRRTFVSHVAAAGLALPLISTRLVRAESPNNVIRHACVGVGNMGIRDLKNFHQQDNVHVVAMCDVDSKIMSERTMDARHFTDFRELFDKFEREFDSINVTIPDHMHAPVVMRALDAGKHVYCQKPMTKWLGETRQIMKRAAEARRRGVVTQLGIQNHSRTEFRLARWALEQELIGKVREIHAWSNKKWGGERPMPEPDPVPETLAWDLWLGVAPARPYAKDAYHTQEWRAWLDFGTGLLGDMACHVLDSPMAGLGLGLPRKITSEGPAPGQQNWPSKSTIHFDFDGNDRTAGSTVRLTWYDGETSVPDDIRKLYPFRIPRTGAMVVGDQGAMLIPHIGAPRLAPTEKFADVRFPKPEPMDHYGNYIQAISEGIPAEAPLDTFGGLLVSTVLMGTIAQRCPNKTLTYDAATEQFTGDGAAAEANALIIRPYRTGW